MEKGLAPGAVEGDEMLVMSGQYFHQDAILVCDGRCEKAWGMGKRPRVQLSDDEDGEDYAYLADDELGTAPLNPGTSEGGHLKPQTLEGRMHSKWCWRQCERSKMCEPGEWVDLPDFSRRWYNFKGKH